MELPVAEAVCLALLAESSQHGWALVRTLAPDGPVGRVWSLSRPLTYRAIDSLVARGLVVRVGEEVGAGPRRQRLEVTASGRRAAAHWLSAPVEHLRDVRTELLVKLVLVERAGGDATGLLERQREQFAPMVAALAAATRRAGADAVDAFDATSIAAGLMGDSIVLAELHRRSNLVEDGPNVRTQQGHGGEADNRDQGDHQSIFDHRGAGFILVEFSNCGDERVHDCCP